MENMELSKLLCEISPGLLEQFDPLFDGVRISATIKVNGQSLIFSYKRMECGACTIVHLSYGEATYRFPMWCLHYRDDCSYACSNPDCIICSFKEMDFAGGIVKLLIHGDHYTPHHVFARIDQCIIEGLMIDIHIVEGDNSIVRYIGVSRIIPLQYGFELFCHGVDAIRCCENYANKKSVREIWLKTDAINMIRMYPNVEVVHLINPRFRVESEVRP
jgi:hypothetical protein